MTLIFYKLITILNIPLTMCHLNYCLRDIYHAIYLTMQENICQPMDQIEKYSLETMTNLNYLFESELYREKSIY
jgi:hypothetical protein